MKGRGRGLSLVEVLATLFLFSICLAVVSQLLANSQQALKHSRGQDRSVQAALVTLNELRDEVKEATTVVVPASATVATTLELRKANPNVARFPSPLPATSPTGWTLFPANSLVTVRYKVVTGDLVREIVSGLPVASYPMAEGISDLKTRLLAGGNVEISFAVAEQQKSQTLLTSVYRFR